MNNFELIELIVAGVISIVDFFLLRKIIFAYRHFGFKKSDCKKIDLADLPTISVCMPVRNEGRVIKDSLDLILDSDYPKMEVIVLDDDSVDNTSDIIKSFAHKGVRFIKGRDLELGWIGKNKALKELSEQANGDYILFLSVDTKITKTTISKLISMAVCNDYKMISVMPRIKKFSWSVVFGTMRFFWETVLHSENLPAISTSAWLIERQSLIDYKDFFKRHKATVRPEDSLARYFYEDNSYRFLIANDNLDVTFEKDWPSQIATSIRTLAPLFEKNVWLSVVIAIKLLSVIAGWSILLLSLANGIIYSWTVWLLLIVLSIFSLIQFSYSLLARTKALILGMLVVPYTVLQEFILLVLSYYRYKKATVSWKGRKLPEVED